MSPILFVFAQKPGKFQVAANGMRTIRRWHSAGSQSHPHIRTFGSHVFTGLYFVLKWESRFTSGLNATKNTYYIKKML